jgi:hypothetical protein
MHTQITQILDEYAQMELEEIRLLKTRALPEGFDRQDCVSLQYQQGQRGG